MRSAPAALLLVLAGVVAACGAAPSPAPATPEPTDPAPSAPSPTLPATGDVSTEIPELGVEPLPDGRLRIGVLDPTAKAWRVTIMSADRRERWELEVTTADIEPLVVAREVRDGAIVAEEDLGAFIGDPTAASGGCHPTLAVCYGTTDVRLPEEGDGELALIVELVGPPADLLIVGSTAGWPGEPFILGPWHDTDLFPFAG